MIPPEYIAPYITSQTISVLLLLSAFKWPRVTRAGFVLIFLAACAANSFTAITIPHDYLDYREFAWLDAYRAFIDGFFAEHTQVIVLIIAAGQFCIAVLLTQRGFLLTLGVIGAVVFFIGIAPLGLGSAMPSPILLIVALVVMYRNLVQKEEAALPESVVV